MQFRCYILNMWCPFKINKTKIFTPLSNKLAGITGTLETKSCLTLYYIITE